MQRNESTFPHHRLDAYVVSLQLAVQAKALQHTGTMSVRRRRLPARLVVRLVISMALFRDCAIRTVATQLGLPNPWGKARSGHRDRSVASTAGHAQRLVIDYAEHRPVTTRTHLAGSYRLELLVNGTSLGVVDFELKCP